MIKKLHIKESLLKEGPGAGYTIKANGFYVNEQDIIRGINSINSKNLQDLLKIDENKNIAYLQMDTNIKATADNIMVEGYDWAYTEDDVRVLIHYISLILDMNYWNIYNDKDIISAIKSSIESCSTINHYGRSSFAHSEYDGTICNGINDVDSCEEELDDICICVIDKGFIYSVEDAYDSRYDVEEPYYDYEDELYVGEHLKLYNKKSHKMNINHNIKEGTNLYSSMKYNIKASNFSVSENNVKKSISKYIKEDLLDFVNNNIRIDHNRNVGYLSFNNINSGDVIFNGIADIYIKGYGWSYEEQDVAVCISNVELELDLAEYDITNYQDIIDAICDAINDFNTDYYYNTNKHHSIYDGSICDNINDVNRCRLILTNVSVYTNDTNFINNVEYAFNN